MKSKSERAQPPAAPGVHPRKGWSLRPASDREAGDAIVSNFVLHGFPAKSYKASLSWTYSFWLGTVSVALLLLLTLSGLPLLFLYIPSVERAYASVKDIEYVITFGSWIRAVHRISAHLMVAVVFLHMVRVFLTGAYKNGVGRNQKREWNWVLGIGMLLLTLFLSFTGYLLPWDQLAYWAVTVGTNIASSIPFAGPTIRELLIGGRTIEQATLIRFYVLHVLFLPMGIGALF
ncbi:MAG TPA: cytochrome b N-terminal domain-containing protein, partial [Thermoanaerobaculia bacterium]